MVTVTQQKRVVGYIRVSTEKQVGDGHQSLQTQENRIRESVTASGDLLIHVFRDVQSGRRDDRPEYQQMVRYVLENEIDVVLVQYLDRFGRRPQEILTRIWKLQEHGISVEATDQDISEELMLLVNAGMAGHESKRTSERVRANMVNIVKSGTHSGKAPYGFKAVKEIVAGKARVVRWEHDEDEVEIVREMVRLSVQENLGFKAIADNLNGRGLRRDSGHWVASSVRHILRNPVLKGLMVYGRRSKTGNPKGEVIEVPGVFPPVLSDEDWDKLQQRLDIRKGAPRGSVHKSAYLLTSIAKCGHCGGPLVGKAGSAYKGRRYRSYVCSNANKSRAACAFYNGHAARKLESAVLEYLGQFSDPNRVAELLNESGRTELKRKRSELAKLEKKLTALDHDFKKNLEYLKKNLLSEEEFAKANTFQRDERVNTESRLADLRSEVEVAENREANTSALPDQIKSFVESFDTLETSKAKAVLQTILKAAHVWRGGKVELEFR